MNLLVDEGVDRQIVEHLRQTGHSVLYIAEMAPGIDDDEVLDLAIEDQALLLTTDKDFGELVYRQKRLTTGVILIRLAGLSPARKAEIVTSAIGQHSEELSNAFAVVTPGAIRIRQSGT
jgi:predicted nuclease of predicted toxin-antitoxin system